MPITIVNITNNGDGTYTIQFSDAIGNSNPGTPTPDPNFIFYSVGQNAWFYINTNADSSGNTIIVTCFMSFNDCTQAMLLSQPATITGATTFQTTTPVTPIT